ncbi:RidA family protein [Hoeflea sp. YIM 152468]|uniref:RidA family protein n=1 Tax=Hoeflea sp. YIM 152468 TaxID=3031759 RepID=UPI0023DC144C|nr:RidA family protein [Hoeflea sp. YIM 152468]MDF1610338.1 RidA family protein [Hoeflea sp. YIM 152468]
MPRFFNPDSMAKPASNYVQAVEMVSPGRRLLISGQIGVTPDGQMRDGYRAQAEQAWRNGLAAVAACNMKPSDIVAIRVYDVAPGDVTAYREIRDQVLEGHAPASTYVIVAGLAHPDLLTEIEIEAFSQS